MSDVMLQQVTDNYYDVLKEIGNIGAGNAMTALSQMLQCKVDMKVPQVRLLEFSEVGDLMGGEEQIMAGVYLGVEGDITGSMMFMVEEHSARHLIQKITMGMLPEVRSSSEIYGTVNYAGIEIPLAGCAGDQQAALFGQACFEQGEVKNTYGTGCFLLMNTGESPVFSSNGLITTIAWGFDHKVIYALEGSVFMGGAVVQWLRDGIRMISAAEESERYAEEAKEGSGCYMVPAFTGMGAPYWNPYARGMIVGLTRGTGRQHLVRAGLESIAYQVHDVLRAMEADAGIRFEELKADGGASANHFLMQREADILGVPVKRPRNVETTAWGAACMAGLAAGFWNDLRELKESFQEYRIFKPETDESSRRKELEGWKRAVRCALAWAREERS